MNALKKKPLTHKKCVRSDMFGLKLFVFIILLTPVYIPFDEMNIGELFSVKMILPMLLLCAFFIFGIFVLISAIKTRMMLMSKKYFIYIDTVVAKGYDSDDDGTSYYLRFAHNGYKKTVSRRKWEQIQLGTPYFLIQVNNEKHAFAAFAESEYYLDQSVYNQLKRF